jgi:hypothetical protein
MCERFCAYLDFFQGIVLATQTVDESAFSTQNSNLEATNTTATCL